MSTIQDKTKDIAKKMLNIDRLQNLVSSTSKLTIAIVVIIIFIIGGFVYWNYSLASIPSKTCIEFSEVYLNPEAINNTGLGPSNFNGDGAACTQETCPTGIWADKNLQSATLKNQPYFSCYRIKTAYNCCALTNFQNTYVNICALESCIAQGYRALDFEVYFINGKAQIAVSSKSSVHVKTSYNAIPCTKAFTVIKNRAFNTEYCPNYQDPLVLILRMKSQHVACFNSVAAAIETTIKNNLLDTQTYGSECTNSGLAGGINDIPASAFMGQNIIIIVDDSVNNGRLLPAACNSVSNHHCTMPSNPSKLWQYTHGTIGTTNKQVGLTTYSNLISGDVNTHIANSKNKTVIVYPEYSPNANSVPIMGCKKPVGDCHGPIGTIWYGSQMAGTCNQTVLDPIKQSNDLYFKNVGRAWVLRDPYFLADGQSVPSAPPPAANTLFRLQPLGGVNIPSGTMNR